MRKLEALQDFTLQRFDELKNIERANKNEYGKLFKEDTFECEDELAKYLLGDNPLNKAVVYEREDLSEVEQALENVIQKDTNIEKTNDGKTTTIKNKKKKSK